MPCVQLRSKEQDGGLRYFRATRKSCCKLYIQSRRFNEAAELCRKARQPRKAARLRGLFYFSDGIIVSELRLLRSLTQRRYAIIAVKPRGWMAWTSGQAIKTASFGKPHVPELLPACVFFSNRILLSLNPLFSPCSPIKSGYYTQSSHFTTNLKRTQTGL